MMQIHKYLDTSQRYKIDLYHASGKAYSNSGNKSFLRSVGTRDFKNSMKQIGKWSMRPRWSEII